MRLVVLLITLPFCIRSAIFFHGCIIPGPLRPLARLFTRRIKPGKKRTVRSARIKPVISG
jgi:hypothetical protein